jgi:hypothetical protein
MLTDLASVFDNELAVDKRETETDPRIACDFTKKFLDWPLRTVFLTVTKSYRSRSL